MLASKMLEAAIEGFAEYDPEDGSLSADVWLAY